MQFNRLKAGDKYDVDAEDDSEAPENPLQHFLTHLALVAGDPREGKSKFEKVDAINCLTMHAAKVQFL